MAESGEQSTRKPTCFVIMPISDAIGYEAGHFGRVYEHLLKPAIIAAGYTPVRADDTVKTDYIVVGIIQKIVESEMVICDISARNANVMYELGIRHAFNKPVVLVKDKKTEKIFDIQGLRYTEYDETLRIDAVTKDVPKLSSAITETAGATSRDTNSIVHLAGIKTAEPPATQMISADTQLILSAINDLERRVDDIQRRDGRLKPIVEHVIPAALRGKSNYDVGSKVYKNGKLFGIIDGFFDNGKIVIIKTEEGDKISLIDMSKENLKELQFEFEPKQ